MPKPSVLIVIPARGGSKGIPRKNLRILGDKPLLAYAITTALKSAFSPVVCVSSDDEEILSLAHQLGAETIERDGQLAGDSVTLDPVLHHALKVMEDRHQAQYDLLVTMQPTSPLLQTQTLDRAIQEHWDQKIETTISCVDNTHLTWRKENERFLPNYRARLNRQYLPKEYKETGGFFISNTSIVTPTSRFGQQVSLFEVSKEEGIDIDHYDDWALCEFYINRKTILFVVTGNREKGLGHVYNSLIVAHHILDHHIIFLCTAESQLAFEKISAYNFKCLLATSADLPSQIQAIAPDVVINDVLDTSHEYISQLKQQGCTVINFEDLGQGAQKADLVFNAIYPEQAHFPEHYFGASFFCVRDEFVLQPKPAIRPQVQTVLITFGGTDPNNLTAKAIEALYDYCQRQHIRIKVITGFGYQLFDTLRKYPGIHLLHDVKSMANEIAESDICITSAGRTTFEVACLGVPGIVLAQNEREMTHLFADDQHGFVNLGLGKNATHQAILDTFISLVDNFDQRIAMNQKLLAIDVSKGRKRVIGKIKELIREKHD